MPKDLILLDQVQYLLPRRNGKPVGIDAIYCWVRQGVRFATGGMVKLRVQRIGGGMSQTWLETFIRACTTPKEMDFPGRHRAMSVVKRRLIARGVYGPEANEQELSLQRADLRRNVVA
jgi:hypothetical protein